MTKTIGNIDFAIRNVIERLVRAKNSPPLAKFAEDVLAQWDADRGKDWITSTKVMDENKSKYCFVSDGDAGRFLIPVDLVDDFNKTLEEGQEDWYAEFSSKFEKYSIDSVYNYTFENPE